MEYLRRNLNALEGEGLVSLNSSEQYEFSDGLLAALFRIFIDRPSGPTFFSVTVADIKKVMELT
jgi:hypothetical protein